MVLVSGAGANTSLSNLNATNQGERKPCTRQQQGAKPGSSNLSWKNIYYNGSIYSGNNRILNGDIVNANTSIGYHSGALNTTGAFNTASGYAALMQNTQAATIPQAAIMRLPQILQVAATPAQALFRCTKTQQEAVMSHLASTRFIQTPAPTIIQLLFVHASQCNRNR